MKQRIVCKVIFPTTNTTHIIEYYEISTGIYPWQRTLHGYIVDSETLQIGMDICTPFNYFISEGVTFYE